MPINQRWSIEARNITLFGKPADQEDGRLMSQNNHLMGSGCQVLLQNREVVRWGSKVKRPFILQISSGMASLGGQFSSVAQSCPTLCDPMDCSKPGLPVITNSQSLLNLMSIESVMPFNHLILCLVPFSSRLQSFPVSGSFQMSQFFASGGQSRGVSASASVLPVNIQDWFPLGWTGWISLQSKGLSRIFSNTTVQKHQFFGAQLSL